MTSTALVRSAGREVLWWAGEGLRLVRRWPGQFVVFVSVVWLTGWTPWSWVLTAAVAAVGLRVWARLASLSFQRLLYGPFRMLAWRIRLRRRWTTVAWACGLGTHGSGLSVDRGSQRREVPRLRRMTGDGPRLSLHLRPLVGQTVDTVAEAAERLRMAVGATRVKVDPEGVNEVVVTFTIGDSLAAPFTAAHPRLGGENLDSVLMGRCEDGSEWRLPVGPHTLVAGMSGSGKGSVFWSFVLGLAREVRTGRVQLHGVDLKGGMEILMGAQLFSTRATNAVEAVVLLERLVEMMRTRTRRYAGQTRSHVATEKEPLHVVMIDELAALTAYCPERDLQRRAEMAVNLLCSQGRAPGFMVFACLQDPRKEVIPSRGLFTQMVGLRLKDAAETSMVLGEATVAAGAACHRITRATPGMGYVVPEDGGYPMRVRAGFVSDAEIRTVAKEFATPSFHQLDVPVQMPLNLPRRPRQRLPYDPEVA